MTRPIRRLKSMFDDGGPRSRFMLVEAEDGLHKIVDCLAAKENTVVGFCNTVELGMSIVKMMNRVDREIALELEREVFGDG